MDAEPCEQFAGCFEEAEEDHGVAEEQIGVFHEQIGPSNVTWARGALALHQFAFLCNDLVRSH